MRLVIASNNKGKIAEIKAILGGIFPEIVSQREAGLELEVEETGSTFAENSYLKAAAVSRALSCAALADDSGLCVDALGGAPGVHSARYAGEEHDDAANNAKLLEAVSGFEQPVAARFVSCVTIVYPDGASVSAEGEAKGELLREPRGTEGFGYDPLFYYPPLGKTFAQLTADEKNSVSHRRAALDALYAKLLERM